MNLTKFDIHAVGCDLTGKNDLVIAQWHRLQRLHSVKNKTKRGWGDRKLFGGFVDFYLVADPI